MAVVTERMGVRIPIDRILRELPRNGRESSFEEPEEFAVAHGLCYLAVRWDRLPVVGNTVPGIIPISRSGDRRHFVALLGSRDANVWIQDFPSAAIWMTEKELRQRHGWDGTTLHVARESRDFEALIPKSPGYRVPLIGLGVLLAVLACVDHVVRHPVGRLKGNHLRSGYTLLDIMVVIAIIGLLCSLLAPAIERSREAAQRLSCLNREKQLSLAIANFASAQNRLPNVDSLPTTTGPFGMPLSPNISIQALLLPYLDQTSVYQTIRLNDFELDFSATGATSQSNSIPLKTRVAVFECASDAVPAGGCSFVLSCGTSPGLHGNFGVPIGEAAAAGYIGQTRSQFASLTDGLSQTVILSERLVGGQSRQHYDPTRDNAYYAAFNGFSAGTAARSCENVTNPPADHFSFIGTAWLAAGYGYTWYNHVLTPNSEIPDCSDHRVLGGNTQGCHTARSAHPRGVNAALGDGSVRFFSENINLQVWRALGTSQGGEADATMGIQ